MSRAADFASVAIRLHNAELKTERLEEQIGEGGGAWGAVADLAERIYKNAFMGSDSESGVGYDPVWSNNPSIFDQGGIPQLVRWGRLEGRGRRACRAPERDRRRLG